MGYVYQALRWLFSGLFILAAIGAGLEFPLTGICFLVIVLFLVPPISKLVHSKTGMALPKYGRTVGIVVLLVITAGVAGYEERQREAQIAAREAKEQAQKAAELRQQRIDEFKSNREEVIQSVQQAISANRYEDAIENAEEYLIVEDEELRRLYNKAKSARDEERRRKKTEEILTKLKTIPVEQYARNKKLYAELVNMYPDNEKYQEKLDFYTTKIADEKERKMRKTERKKRIKEQFSAWDGSHRNLTKVIKKAMNDPDSYDHVETVYWDRGDHLVVRTVFRGRNAFGGVVKNSVTAKVSLDGQVLEIISQE